MINDMSTALRLWLWRYQSCFFQVKVNSERFSRDSNLVYAPSPVNFPPFSCVNASILIRHGSHSLLHASHHRVETNHLKERKHTNEVPRPKSPKGLKKHLWNFVFGDCNCFHINWSYCCPSDIWLDLGFRHVFQQLHGMLPLAALATWADRTIEADHISNQASHSHVVQQNQSLPCCARWVWGVKTQFGEAERFNYAKVKVLWPWHINDIMLLRGAIHIPHRQSTSCLRLPAASVGFFRSNWLRCWRWCYQAEVWPRRHSGR